MSEIVLVLAIGATVLVLLIALGAYFSTKSKRVLRATFESANPTGEFDFAGSLGLIGFVDGGSKLFIAVINGQNGKLPVAAKYSPDAIVKAEVKDDLLCVYVNDPRTPYIGLKFWRQWPANKWLGHILRFKETPAAR